MTLTTVRHGAGVSACEECDTWKDQGRIGDEQHIILFNFLINHVRMNFFSFFLIFFSDLLYSHPTSYKSHYGQEKFCNTRGIKNKYKI